MSAEARYFRVGVFVFAGAILIGSCAVMLGGGELFKKKLLMETYFDEAVTGLEVGSPVKLLGVPIGKVAGIAFVTQQYELPSREAELRNAQRIRVLMEITPPADPELEMSSDERHARVAQMIDRGLRLQLSTGILTGQSIVQGTFLDPKRFPAMELDWEPRHLYVPSAPSTGAQISSAAERIFEKLEAVEVDKVVENLDSLISDLRSTNRRAQRAIDGSRYDLQVTLENLRVTSDNLRDLSDTLRSQPSLLIRGGAPERAEPVR
ncbi:MAG: MCE family protein [Deltaproteobacteria bacterium]|nr:MAG: MCE family protein [Deltaproteobacteria bacterium]